MSTRMPLIVALIMVLFTFAGCYLLGEATSPGKDALYAADDAKAAAKCAATYAPDSEATAAAARMAQAARAKAEKARQDEIDGHLELGRDEATEAFRLVEEAERLAFAASHSCGRAPEPTRTLRPPILRERPTYRPPTYRPGR